MSISVRALDPHKQLGDFRRQTWQIDSGLPQNTVHAVLQTRDGFVWMATESGLVRFDGVEFRTFDVSNTPEFHSNLVDDLLEARDGTLWISTSDGLVRRRAGKFTAFSTAQGLPSNAVMRVSQQRSGSLVVVTAAGLAVGDGERFREIAGTELVSRSERVVMLADDAQGTLWAAAGAQLISVRAGAARAEAPVPGQVGTIQAIALSTDGDVWVGGTQGAQCLCAGKQRSAATRVLLPSSNVTALLSEGQPNGAGDVWIGTTTGLSVFSHGVAKPVGIQEGLSGVDVRRLFEDRLGALWVMYSRGLARVVAGRVQIAPPETSVGDVLSVSEDSENDLWFGTGSGGTSVLRDQMFSSISMQQGQAADYIRTVFQDRSGTIWIGSNGGGLSSFSGGKITPLKNPAALAGKVVLSLAETGPDLWVGTTDGLTRIRGGSSQVFTSTDGLADNFVRSLYADSDGSLWIGTRNGLSHFKDGRFRSYSTLDGLGNDVVGSVLRTRAGELWVATLGGLSRLSGNRFVNYTKRDGLGGDAVTALFEDDDRSLWIGTNGSGLNRLRGGRLTWFPPQKTGTPETVYGIVEDQGNNLWLSSQRGVYRVSIAGLNAYADKGSGEIAVAGFGAADGMRISECSSGGHPAAWRMADASLWFATPKGVAWVNPEVHSEPDQAPQIAIEQISVDNQLKEQADMDANGVAHVDVPAGRERLAIHYAGLSFRAPQKVRYRYMLAGFDHGWVEAGASRTAYYTNVPPGRYTFSVMAAGSDAVWGLPSSVEFEVQPRFFETRWFFVLAGAVILGLAYAAYRARVRFVEGTFKAVMAERGRIAREVHDTLAQGYVGIAVHLEIASRLLEHSDGSREAALAQVNETKDLVRSGLAEARSSIWDLRSGGEESETLPVRVAAAARLKTNGGGPPLAFNVHGTYRQMPRQVEDEVLRIAVEAVTNAVRHAHATNIGVTLTYDAKTIVVSVCDDGRGFSETEQSLAERGHFGVKGMHERAAAIGAVLHIDGAQGEGTEVTLTLNARRVAGKDRD